MLLLPGLLHAGAGEWASLHMSTGKSHHARALLWLRSLVLFALLSRTSKTLVGIVWWQIRLVFVRVGSVGGRRRRCFGSFFYTCAREKGSRINCFATLCVRVRESVWRAQQSGDHTILEYQLYFCLILAGSLKPNIWSYSRTNRLLQCRMCLPGCIMLICTIVSRLLAPLVACVFVPQAFHFSVIKFILSKSVTSV